ncbi:putative transposase [Alloalcanivorax xenomutans]|uniref:Rpn family recombination-promoting nuclease/putative transposase n=1 Tax=Alloalcanivorax xenomutans TaxID=1094342 RepID=UPI0006D5B7EA|nr:Rpn family recombination-promoting nuclease/putative transposase [Alloalcanivorax xenomutans]PHS71885.1 MAG: transposase [Alcanivorax sp.]CUR46531.1 putative transposase [Alloalcanivorax xenomutans]
MGEHDTAYKFLFSHRALMRDLLLGFMEGDWVQELDLNSLEKVSDGYATGDLLSRHNDALWRVRWKREWIYLYLMLEFQSTVERFMPVRILTYIGLLYQDLIRREELSQDRRLPPVLPIVLYNGKGRWRAPVALDNLIQPPPHAVLPYLPRLQFLLLDEGALLHEGALPGQRNLVAAIFRLEQSQAPEDLSRAFSHLLEWLKGPEQSELRQAILEWLHRRGPSLAPEISWREVRNLQEANTMLEERIQEWKAQFRREGLTKGREEGREIGLEEGREEGRKEGREEGSTAEARNILRRQLARRFGTVPEHIDVKLNGASREQLEDWIDRPYEVEELEDVFR